MLIDYLRISPDIDIIVKVPVESVDESLMTCYAEIKKNNSKVKRQKN
jgi:hypothetical protein